MNNPRELALCSLVKSDTQECFSNIEIGTVLSRASLGKSDAALYTLLYLGVLEKKLYLDKIIEEYSSIPLAKIDVETKNIIRLGLYQLVFTDRIPDYSAVDSSVELAPRKSKGFVNAVLRSFLRGNKHVSLPSDPWENASVVGSMPKELMSIFDESYGKDTALELATYENKDFALSLRVNTLLASVDEILDDLKKRGYEPCLSKYAPDIIKCSVAVSEIKDLIDTGRVFIQDESSRICSLAVGALPNEKVGDMCACPGGKTFSMAIDMENKGEIKASDLHKNKLGLVEKGAGRLGIEIISVKAQNAKEYVAEYDAYFDRILCDVPCSGLGVIYKKPEIKYKSVDNIKALPQIQYDILKNCSHYVKVGGYLIYSTCTLNRCENEENVLRFLRENDGFEPCDFDVGEISSKGGMYTFFPYKTGTDGFFIAKMRRVK